MNRVSTPWPVAQAAMGPHGLRQAGHDLVVVGGWVRRPMVIDAAVLADRQAATVGGFVVICTVDGPHGPARPLRGVSLCELIQAAEPAFEERTDFKRTVVIASSREGYRAVFSWNELFNSPVGGGVLLAWNAPEAPLPEGAGPFALVSLLDHATGPRYVQRLAHVELHKLW